MGRDGSGYEQTDLGKNGPRPERTEATTAQPVESTHNTLGQNQFSRTEYTEVTLDFESLPNGLTNMLG